MPDRLRSVLRGLLLAVLASIIVVGIASGGGTNVDRVEQLGSRIRCPVCSGESIAASPSETARAMMEIVAEQVASGATDAQVLAYFQARYGDVILLDPPARGPALLLWVLPALALGIGAFLAVGQLRKSSEERR